MGHVFLISITFISILKKKKKKKIPRIFPPVCFLLASSWSIIPQEVVKTMKPNCLEGMRELAHFSISFNLTSNRGLITPHLLILPMRLTNFARTVIINYFKFTNVTVLHHDSPM